MRTLKTFTLLTIFFFAALGTASGQQLSLTPTTGPGGIIVTATSSGFDRDNVGYQTGFYLDNVLRARCPPPNPFNTPNCSVTFQVPYGPAGEYTITAFNSNPIGESASQKFTVLPPKLTIQPTCGPPGTEVDIKGTNFPLDFTSRIAFDGNSTGVHIVADSSGNVSATIEVPSLSDGRYRVSAEGNFLTNVGQTFTVGTACAQVGRLTDVSGTVEISSDGDNFSEARVGDPVYMNDVIRTDGKANSRATVILNDQTHLQLSSNAELKVDDYIYNPSTHDGQASYSFLKGAFTYLSGLVGKKDPPNLNIETSFGTIGIRGTEFIGQKDEVADTIEIDLIHGSVDISPNKTVTTTTHTAPIKIVFDGSVATTSPLTQEEYDALKARLFPAATLDTTPPVPDAASLPEIIGQCFASLPAAPTATDAYDGRIVGVPDQTGPFGQGDDLITWTFTDAAGNRSTQTQAVHVHDTTAPLIVLTGANPMTIELGSLFSDPGAKANDGCHSALPVTVSGSVNTNAIGTYTLTYNAKDTSNNSTQVTRTVKVVDTTAPKVVAPAASSLYSDINCRGAIPNLLPQIVASDLGGLVTLIQHPAAGTSAGVGQQTIIITGTDQSGNKTTVTTTFSVIAGPSFTVSVSPSSVKRGSSVTLSTAFNNCANTNQVLTLQVSLINPSSKTLVISLPFTTKPGQKGSLALPVPISSSTPTGNYSLTLDVYLGGVKIGTSTAQLTVT